MIDGKQKVDWNHTAALMTLTANVNRGKSSDKQFTPADFHPYADLVEKRKPKINKAAFELLKEYGGGNKLGTHVIKSQDERPREDVPEADEAAGV